IAVIGFTHKAAGPSCKGLTSQLDGIWDDGVREQVRAAWAKVPFGPDTFTRVAAALDAYAGAWKSMRVEACEATAVHHTQSPSLLDLRMNCLDRRRGELSALTQLFAGDKDGKLAERAV